MKKPNYFKRVLHLIFGHELEGSVQVDKLTSEKHPHSDEKWLYTVNIRECKCGLFFFDCGVEYRDRSLSAAMFFIGLVVGVIITVIASIEADSKTEAELKAKAVELKAATWVVDQKTGKTKFQWKELAP